MNVLEENLVKYMINLRNRLYKVLNSVQDSTPYNSFWHMPTKASVEFKQPINEIINFAKEWAEDYGLYYVTVYFHPSYSGNKRYIFDTGKIFGKVYEISELPQDTVVKYSRYFEFRDISYNKILKCPKCHNKSGPHDVKEGYIIISSENLYKCEFLVSILDHLYKAISFCEYKSKRSNIREYILRAIVEVNNLVYPYPIEKVIDDFLVEAK